MPSMRTRSQQPTPVSAQVEMPSDFPAIPQAIIDHFPDAADWQSRLDQFWTCTNQAIQQAQQQVANYNNSRVTFSVDTFQIYAKNGSPQPMFALDSTGVRIGNVLVIDTPARKVYIGAGTYQSADTPFYVDTMGNFSLGANFVWAPSTATLTITGVINATSGKIGGFTIGATSLHAGSGASYVELLSIGGGNALVAGANTTAKGEYSKNIAYFSYITVPVAAIGGQDNTTLDSGFVQIYKAGNQVFYLSGDLEKMFFGAASDTNLYRSAANTLKTDGAFIVTGKVGIGVSSPNEPLEIAGTGRMFLGDGGGASRKGLLFDAIEDGTYARIHAYDYGAVSSLNLVLNPFGGGNVGIGTITPSAKLDVNGFIKQIGNVQQTSDVTVTASTSLVDLPGLSILLEAGQTYYFQVMVMGSTTGTGGFALSPVASGGLTTSYAFFGFNGGYTSAANGPGGFPSCALTANTMGVNYGADTVGATNFTGCLFGTIVVNVAGTFKIQMAQHSANGSATVHQGSFMTVTKC